jgi:hypothetical protein
MASDVQDGGQKICNLQSFLSSIFYNEFVFGPATWLTQSHNLSNYPKMADWSKMADHCGLRIQDSGFNQNPIPSKICFPVHNFSFCFWLDVWGLIRKVSAQEMILISNSGPSASVASFLMPKKAWWYFFDQTR